MSGPKCALTQARGPGPTRSALSHRKQLEHGRGGGRSSTLAIATAGAGDWAAPNFQAAVVAVLAKLSSSRRLVTVPS